MEQNVSFLRLCRLVECLEADDLEMKGVENKVEQICKLHDQLCEP